MKKIYTLSILLAIAGVSSFGQITTNGLFAFYPFNGNAIDSSGNGQDGVVVEATPTTDKLGNSDGAYLFNGYSSYIEFPNNFDSLSRTLDLWFYAFDADYSYSYGAIFQSDNTVLKYGNTGVAIKDLDGQKKLLLTISGTSDTVNLKLNSWNNIAITLDSDKVVRYYYNGHFIRSKSFVNYVHSVNGIQASIIGASRSEDNQYFHGKIDDIRFYNRSLTDSEISSIYHENCNSATLKLDTTTYYVSSSDFQQISPKVYQDKTDSFNSAGGCDSLIIHYSKFIFKPSHYTDTTYTSVEDTLKFNITLSGISAPDNITEMKVYPNPTKDYLWIDCGDYIKMSNYHLNLTNISSTVLWSTIVTDEKFSINLSGYSKGIYFLEIFDDTNTKLDVKKIILQ